MVLFDQTWWSPEGPTGGNLDEPRRRVEVHGKSTSPRKERKDHRGGPGRGSQPRAGPQEKGDDKAGVEDEEALRGRERLGEEREGATKRKSSPRLRRLPRGWDR